MLEDGTLGHTIRSGRLNYINGDKDYKLVY